MVGPKLLWPAATVVDDELLLLLTGGAAAVVGKVLLWQFVACWLRFAADAVVAADGP